MSDAVLITAIITGALVIITFLVLTFLAGRGEAGDDFERSPIATPVWTSITTIPVERNANPVKQAQRAETREQEATVD